MLYSNKTNRLYITFVLCVQGTLSRFDQPPGLFVPTCGAAFPFFLSTCTLWKSRVDAFCLSLCFTSVLHGTLSPAHPIYRRNQLIKNPKSYRKKGIIELLRRCPFQLLPSLRGVLGEREGTKPQDTTFPLRYLTRLRS